MRLDSIPRLRSPYRVVPRSPNEVLIHTGVWTGVSYVIRDDRELGLLTKSLQALDGQSTLETVIDRIGRKHEQDLIDLVN